MPVNDIYESPLAPRSSHFSLPVLSAEQRDAAADIARWRAQNSSPFYLLSGCAGVGKTTVVTALNHELRGHVSYVALTGKAASVLRRKGAAEATTIHRLMYHAPKIKNDELIWERREDPPEADLIIADECSTIDNKLGRDLLALGIPVLATGDGFQLPPIGGKPFFTGIPHYTLTEIHRQARDSPVLDLAVKVQGGERIKPIKFDLDRMLGADMVIVALRDTRRLINKMWRRAFGEEGRYPIEGDRVLCFKTNYAHGVLNGEVWMVDAAREDDRRGFLRLHLIDDLGNAAEVIVPEEDFLRGPTKLQSQNGLDSFDFGYCITCHKAQGSEWDRICIIDETRSRGFRFMAQSSELSPGEFTARWLYTAVTRAVSRVDLMEPPR